VLNTIYLTDSTLNNRCLTFENLRVHPNNYCLPVTFSVLMANKISKRSCLECEIKDIDITIAKSCRGSFTCISFLFDNNTFFRQHPKIIHYLQEAPQNKPM